MFSNIVFALWLARTASNSGVFRYNPKALHGIPIYFLYLDNKVQCLRACYEESKCAVVEYYETSGFCRLYKNGSTPSMQGYTLFREETDFSCMTETTTSKLSFQKIPRQENATTIECTITRDVAVIQPYESSQYRFFLLKPHPTFKPVGRRLLFSKIAGRYCNSVPVFHKASPRRLYFGEIYNNTGYFFYNAYAFTDYCVSARGECLGVQEIQEYVDEHGRFFYDEPRRENMTDSGLGQIFYIAGIEY